MIFFGDVLSHIALFGLFFFGGVVLLVFCLYFMISNFFCFMGFVCEYVCFLCFVVFHS